jgi:hypothetical protein
MTKRFWIDMLERAIWTFIQAFLAVWVMFFDANADQFFNAETAKAALVAGAVAVAKALMASRIGNGNSASTAPSV